MNEWSNILVRLTKLLNNTIIIPYMGSVKLNNKMWLFCQEQEPWVMVIFSHVLHPHALPTSNNHFVMGTNHDRNST